MMAAVYWILFYDVVDNYVERRSEFRSLHLEYAAKARARGELVMAGALADPVDGAVLVFRADDVSTVEHFAQEDPYVKAGLITSWRVRAWSVVVE
jgi:uncharacterized protein